MPLIYLYIISGLVTITFKMMLIISRNVFRRGIKQGCPLMMLLYIIYIEHLLLRFKKELLGVLSSEGGGPCRFPVLVC